MYVLAITVMSSSSLRGEEGSQELEGRKTWQLVPRPVPQYPDMPLNTFGVQSFRRATVQTPSFTAAAEPP